MCPNNPEVVLRSQSSDCLTEQQAELMIEKYGFYCATFPGGLPYSNPDAEGIRHDYEIKSDGKVVHDRATGLLWERGGINNLSWIKAKEWIDHLNRENFAGISSWRLPTLEEAMSLLAPPDQSGYYIDRIFYPAEMLIIWTADRKNQATAWAVFYINGYVIPYDVNGINGVRAVSSCK